MMRRTRRDVLPLAVLVPLSLLACGGADDDAEPSPESSIERVSTERSGSSVPDGSSGVPASTTPVSAGEADDDIPTSSTSPAGDAPAERIDPGGSIAEAALDQLRLIPNAPPHSRYVDYVDLDRARTDGGLVEPSGGDEEYREHLAELFAPVDSPGAPVSPLIQTSVTTFDFALTFPPGDMRREFGFWFDDVSAVLSSPAGADTIDSYRVEVDPDQLRAAVESDPEWSASIDPTEHARRPYYRWDEGAEIDLTRRSAARPLGRGGQLAFLDGLAIRTVSEGTMQAALDARASGTSLADVPAVDSIVRALDAAGVYQFSLVDPSAWPETSLSTPAAVAGPDAPPERVVAIENFLAENPAPLRPYEWLGMGHGIRDGEHAAVFVLAHGDERSAADNVDRFREILTRGTSLVGVSWSDLYAISSIRQVERLTIVEVEPVGTIPVSTYLRFFGRGDVLFRMEPTQGTSPTDDQPDDQPGDHQPAPSTTTGPTEPDNPVAASPRLAQILLDVAGYGPLEYDGILGPASTSALESFQGDVGLPVTGELDQATFDRLVNQTADSTYLSTCDGPTARPTGFQFSCGDVSEFEDLTWSSWSSVGAEGTGSLRLPCPDFSCDDGSTHEVEPVTIRLGGAQPLQCGDVPSPWLEFTTVTILVEGEEPNDFTLDGPFC